MSYRTDDGRQAVAAARGPEDAGWEDGRQRALTQDGRRAREGNPQESMRHVRPSQWSLACRSESLPKELVDVGWREEPALDASRSRPPDRHPRPTFTRTFNLKLSPRTRRRTAMAALATATTYRRLLWQGTVPLQISLAPSPNAVNTSGVNSYFVSEHLFARGFRPTGTLIDARARLRPCALVWPFRSKHLVTRTSRYSWPTSETTLSTSFWTRQPRPATPRRTGGSRTSRAPQ